MLSLVLAAALLAAQSPLVPQTAASPSPQATPAAPPATPTLRPPTRADVLRGEYGRYRANNDLLSYHLDVRIDPEKKTIAGKNTIKFKMLHDGTRIQLDLADALKVDRIVQGNTELNYERDSGALFVDFPQSKAGQTVSIDVFYS